MSRILPLLSSFVLLALAAPDVSAANARAVLAEKGKPLRVAEVAIPDPGPGQVRIRLRAAGVNPVDWKRVDRAADGAAAFVPGFDGAGVVDALGAGVGGWRVGDAVVARVDGAYAQYTVVDAAQLAPKPKRLDFVQAAGLPVAGETAWRTLDTAGVSAGQRVLVTGAAGGVGSAVVQLAKARGAWVAATASARNHDYLRSLGADAVIDYTAGPFEEKLEGLDVVVNTVDDQGQTASRALRTLRRGGALVSITGPADAAKAEAAGVRNLAPQRPAPNQPGLSTATILTRIGELADAGKYRVHVEETLPLAQAAQAWERSRSGRTRGKLVLAIN